jgi:hypothetical protein
MSIGPLKLRYIHRQSFFAFLSQLLSESLPTSFGKYFPIPFSKFLSPLVIMLVKMTSYLTFYEILRYHRHSKMLNFIFSIVYYGTWHSRLSVYSPPFSQELYSLFLKSPIFAMQKL